jgi:hypothetical protein
MPIWKNSSACTVPRLVAHPEKNSAGSIAEIINKNINLKNLFLIKPFACS